MHRASATAKNTSKNASRRASKRTYQHDNSDNNKHASGQPAALRAAMPRYARRQQPTCKRTTWQQHCYNSNRDDTSSLRDRVGWNGKVKSSSGIEWDGMGSSGIEWDRAGSIGIVGIEWDRVRSSGIEWDRMGLSRMQWDRVEWNRMGSSGNILVDELTARLPPRPA